MDFLKGNRKVIRVRNYSTLEEQNESKPPEINNGPSETPEELSEIIRRIKETQFEMTAKDYRERFRFDPRFYFFIHLFFITFIGLVSGGLIYYFELSNVQKSSFIDATFTSVSAITVTGLFVSNFASYTLNSKIVVFICFSKSQ
jgi:Na+/melibiose symporter-like transporter